MGTPPVDDIDIVFSWFASMLYSMVYRGNALIFRRCPRAAGCVRLPSLAGVLQGKFPVDQLIEHGINIVCTSVLAIQVVSVLPHVNGKQWFHGRCQRVIGIGGLPHFEHAAIEHKPRPTTPEL